jgi:hypothetical protein
MTWYKHTVLVEVETQQPLDENQNLTGIILNILGPWAIKAIVVTQNQSDSEKTK